MSLPFFTAAYPSVDASVDLYEDPGTGVFALVGSITIPAAIMAARYYTPGLGAFTSLTDYLVDAFNTATGAAEYSVAFSTSTTLGGVTAFRWTKAVAARRFRLVFADNLGYYLGFGAAGTYTSTTGTLFTDAILTPTLCPWFTWWPNANQVNVDDYAPVERQVFTTTLTGDGSSFSAQQDDGVLRYWNQCRLAQVLGVRVNSAKSLSPTGLAWWQSAGFASQAQAYNAALDTPNGWWMRCVSGEVQFTFCPDQAAPTSRVERGRIAYAAEAPTDMSGWKGLRPPNVTPAGPAGAQRNVQLCWRTLSVLS